MTPKGHGNRRNSLPKSIENRAARSNRLRRSKMAPKRLPKRSQIEARRLQNRGPEPPKSRPEASKMAFFEDLSLKRVQTGRSLTSWVGKMANLAPTWRPRRLQDRGRNPKKSMLKKASFLASIFKGFGPRFGRVFGRFFQRKFVEKCKNAPLAQSLKIVIFPREN